MARVATRCVLLCEPNSLNPAMALFGALNHHERGLLGFTRGYPRALLQRAGLVGIRDASVGWLTPNNTPQALAELLRRLPYRVPLFGLYTVAVGHKGTAAGADAGRGTR
jgi:hypothetical protein